MKDIFKNNHYKVLELMYDTTLSKTVEEYCPLTQEDIAHELSLSRTVINKIFSDLKNENYISMLTRRKWKLSKKAKTFIKLSKEM